MQNVTRRKRPPSAVQDWKQKRGSIWRSRHDTILRTPILSSVQYVVCIIFIALSKKISWCCCKSFFLSFSIILIHIGRPNLSYIRGPYICSQANSWPHRKCSSTRNDLFAAWKACLNWAFGSSFIHTVNSPVSIDRASLFVLSCLFWFNTYHTLLSSDSSTIYFNFWLTTTENQVIRCLRNKSYLKLQISIASCFQLGRQSSSYSSDNYA
jgi:hypothetical protein